MPPQASYSMTKIIVCASAVINKRKFFSRQEFSFIDDGWSTNNDLRQLHEFLDGCTYFNCLEQTAPIPSLKGGGLNEWKHENRQRYPIFYDVFTCFLLLTEKRKQTNSVLKIHLAETFCWESQERPIGIDHKFGNKLCTMLASGAS